VLLLSKVALTGSGTAHRSSLAEALYMEGRASGLCAQLKARDGFGALEGSLSLFAKGLALPCELFCRGQEVLEKAITLSCGMSDWRGAARSRAALAQLWYAAASSNTNGAAAFIPGNSGHESFERLANLGSFSEVMFELEVLEVSNIWATRLVYASLMLSHRALQELEAIGEAHGALGIQLMKDAGKVHSYAGKRLQDSWLRLAGFEPQSGCHRDQAIAFLSRALLMQQRLQGDEHKNTQNIRRLLESARQGGISGTVETQRIDRSTAADSKNGEVLACKHVERVVSLQFMQASYAC